MSMHHPPLPFLPPHPCLASWGPHRPSTCGIYSFPVPSYTPLFLPFLSQNLLFSVCGLTVCACIICSISAIICCIQIFSLDLVPSVRGELGSRPNRYNGREQGCVGWDWDSGSWLVSTGLASEHQRLWITD